MKAPLSEFLMEDWLEAHRFSAKYNAGESGHRAHSLGELLAGLQPDFSFSLADALLDVQLCDAPNMGFEPLRREVARLHPGAAPEHVLITTGTSEALLLLLRQLRPKSVAVISPAFQLLTEIPRSLDAAIVHLNVRWSETGHPEAPVEAWRQVILQTRPDVFILNHPHNPSGLVLSEDQLEPLLAACDAVGCTVIGDEHYRFLARPLDSQTGRVNLGPTLWRPTRSRFVTGSFIKCAGTPGLRIGWCVGAPEVLAAMQSEKNYLTHTVNPLAQMLALWFLQSFQTQQSFFKPLHQQWSENRSSLESWLAVSKYWLGVSPSGGLVSSLFPVSAREPLSHFENLRRQGVFLLPLSSFNETGMTDRWFARGFRIGLGLSPIQFRELLSVMEM